MDTIELWAYNVLTVKPSEGAQVRQRASRRAAKGQVDVAETQARGQRVAAKLVTMA